MTKAMDRRQFLEWSACAALAGCGGGRHHEPGTRSASRHPGRQGNRRDRHAGCRPHGTHGIAGNGSCRRARRPQGICQGIRHARGRRQRADRRGHGLPARLRVEVSRRFGGRQPGRLSAACNGTRGCARCCRGSRFRIHKRATPSPSPIYVRPSFRLARTRGRPARGHGLRPAQRARTASPASARGVSRQLRLHELRHDRGRGSRERRGKRGLGSPSCEAGVVSARAQPTFEELLAPEGSLVGVAPPASPAPRPARRPATPASIATPTTDRRRSKWPVARSRSPSVRRPSACRSSTGTARSSRSCS